MRPGRRGSASLSRRRLRSCRAALPSGTRSPRPSRCAGFRLAGAQPSRLADLHLAYLWMLFSADALAPNGTVAKLLRDSERFAGDLAKDLRERIYVEVVPQLARAIAAARRLESHTAEDLALTYSMA